MADTNQVVNNRVFDASGNWIGMVSLKGGVNLVASIVASIYNAAAVAITGGAINNATVGATTPNTGTFTTLTNAGARVVRATARAVFTTVAQATATIAANINTTYIATPAAAITVTLAAPAIDGEVRRITFGAATTVTWAPTAPATAVAAKTSFAAGEGIELIYSSVAGTPANAAATTWYPF